MQEPDLPVLIERVAGGDRRAFAALYDATSPLVFGLVQRILGDAATAEEVLVDVYTQIWREAVDYTDEHGRR